MADIHKYQVERSRSALTLAESGPRTLSFKLSCRTVTELYDQPLTIKVELPES